MTHTIYIVDDNVFVREAVITLIEDEPDLAVCGAAETAVGALEVILRLKPDLVLTDFSLPGMSGVELIERLNAMKTGQRAAVLSAHRDPKYADQALAAGAMGYILKDDAEAIMVGIRRVLEDKVYVSPALQRHEANPSEFIG